MLAIWHLDLNFNIELLTEIVKIVGLILFASVKFLFAPSTVYLSGYSYFETICITIVGGWFGVFVFFYLGALIFRYLATRIKFWPAGKNFSKKNRFIVKIKRTYGIIGLATLTPCLISIPIGCMLAARYFRTDRRTLPALLIAVVFWSFVLTSVTSLFG